ncbi:MAG TPA: CvpA family protein [Tetragenococcus sp.]|nr:CvpA family protein [Tetragenococcus sp.]
MVGLLVLLLLLLAFYQGTRRATALQLFYTVGCLLAFLLALSRYQEWGKKIELYVPYLSVNPETRMAYFSQQESFDLDKAYYAAVAFIGWFIVGWLFIKFAMIFAKNLRYRRLLQNDWVVAGVLNTVLMYIVIVMVLKVFTTVPLQAVQNLFTRSFVADLMVKTPLISNLFDKLWFTNII